MADTIARPSAAAGSTVSAAVVAGVGAGALIALLFSVPFGLIVGIVIGVVLGGAVAVSVFVAFPVVASRYVRRAVAGESPDVSQPSHARLTNLVEGLSATMGLPTPEVVVIDDPAINALVTGRDPREATLAVTAGLLEHASRLELEAVLAQQLCLVRDRATAIRDTEAFAASLGRRSAAQAQPQIDADLTAIAVTRYPPALIDALRLAAGGQSPDTHRVLSQLWFVPIGADVAERVEVLGELL